MGLDLGGRLTLQGVFEDRGDTAVGDGLDLDGAQAGRLQALFPMGLAQSQDAQRGAVALLGWTRAASTCSMAAWVWGPTVAAQSRKRWAFQPATA